MIAIPHPQEDPRTRERMNPDTPPPPAADAPLADRLGVLGGGFTLSELTDFLLAPLREHWQYESVQQQFSVYTVARFGKEANLTEATVRAQLGPLLSGLAQVEEPTHAGALEDTVEVTNQILNARHWAAVGFLGAAHLVADQDPPHAFDEQRVPIVRDKYFIPYLVAFLQRLTLARADAEAARVVRSFDRDEHDFTTNLQHLREDLLNFAVSGYFPVVSSREALNRFYSLAQRGLRTQEMFADVRRSLTDLDAARQARHQTELAHDLDANVRTLTEIQHKLDANIHTVASVQVKVEWIEIFIVSIYAAELTKTLAELFGFAHTHTRIPYAGVTTLAWAVIAGLTALFLLKPWQHGHEQKTRPHRIIMMILIVTVSVIGWLVLGIFWERLSPTLDTILMSWSKQ
jgi:hypothetical protein